MSQPDEAKDYLLPDPITIRVPWSERNKVIDLVRTGGISHRHPFCRDYYASRVEVSRGEGSVPLPILKSGTYIDPETGDMKSYRSRVAVITVHYAKPAFQVEDRTEDFAR